MITNHVWWSEGWQARFNYPQDTVTPTFEWWENNIHPEDREKIINSLDNVLESKSEHWTSYYRFKNGDGSYSHVVDSGYFLKNDQGEYEYMVGTISDITADVVAKEELKASEEQYRLLFKQNPIPMFIYDPDSLQFKTINEAAIQKYGYKEEEMIELTILDIRPESEVEYVKKVLSEYSDKERTRFHEAIHQTKSGEKLIVEISSSDIQYKGKKQRLVIINDITDQRKAEERAISAIIEGEERERERIAKELHDGLGQYLSASNMNLKSVYEDIGEMPDELKSTYEAGLRFLNHAISEIRSISQNLLPKAIQDYGLELAAESLTNQLRKLHNIDVYFYSNLNEVELPDKVQINLYRILQEALNNATRHAHPTKIEVQLVYSEGEVLMTIEDNGEGFDMSKTGENGLGIRSIKTRVGAMSANLDIVSNKDRGTILSVVVPIH
jgi:PAS domain S-box-containing protein